MILFKTLAALLIFATTFSIATAQTMPTLKLGSKGEHVEFLQQRLNTALQLNPPIGVDGNFGGGTKTAVIQFQKSRYLGPDGIVGKWTWIALLENIPEGAKVGVKSERVSKLQELLNMTVAPQPTLTPDGDFGAGTKAAVLKLQGMQGITPKNGEVGVETWRELFKLSEQNVPSVPTTGQMKALSFKDTDFWKKVDDELKASNGIAAFHDGATQYVVLNDVFRLEPFIRKEKLTFTDTVKALSTPFPVAINGPQYGFPTEWGWGYGLTSPRTLEGTENQGLIYVGGKPSHPTLTRPAKKMFFIANTPSSNPRYQFGFLDPGETVSGSHNSLGGMGPIIINGLPYANENKYVAGTTGPSTGDPGSALSPKLVHRSNSTYEALNGGGKSVGKTIVAHHSTKKLLMLIVQKDGSNGETLDGIRDTLIGLTFDNAVFLDGSSSSTLALGKDIIVAPASYKNNSHPFGVGFRK